MKRAHEQLGELLAPLIAEFARRYPGISFDFEEEEQGRLRRILPDWTGSAIPVYAMTETRLLPAKTQRFIEFLREQLGTTGNSAGDASEYP